MKRSNGRTWLWALGLVSVALAPGCKGSEYRETAPVSGTVTLNGTPLAGATVVFQPTAESGDPGPASFGETDSDGNFTLQLNGGKEGAVVGKHRVFISTRKMKPSAPNSDSEVEVAAEQVPQIYETEPPRIEVPKGGTEEANIELVGTRQGTGPGVRND